MSPPPPKTVAGNRTATMIGGVPAEWGVISRGTIMKNAAAKVAVATHCFKARDRAGLLVSAGKGPSSGQRPPAARAIRSAISADRVRLPTAGRPQEIVATIRRNRTFLLTLIASQGTKKSRQNMPNILDIRHAAQTGKRSESKWSACQRGSWSRIP
jgi:hypothetical protein